jgi:hypothetical protein
LNSSFRHNGNEINYYYGPSDEISLTNDNDLTVTLVSAEFDPGCTFDSEPSAKTIANIERNSINEMDLFAFPNPFTNAVTIQYRIPGIINGGELRITEVCSGKVIYRKDILESEQIVTLSNLSLAAGMYVCSIFSEGSSRKHVKLISLK